MKMLNKLFSALIAAGLLASCSGTNLDGPDPEVTNPKDGVNMKISIALPSSGGTRAAGDPVREEEVAKDFENNVKEVLLVLADETSDAFIASASSDIATENQKITAESTFNKSVLVNYINSLSTKPDQVGVHVYAFCNPTQALKSAIASHNRGDAASTWMNEVYKLEKDILDYATVSANQNIPMANASQTTLNLPKIADIENGTYAETAYNLGTIDVIRSIARFDYKTVKENNTYSIPVTISGENGNQKINDALQIQLTHMALVNMSNQFYYLHRTKGTTEQAIEEICGSDSRDKMIVDADWSWKSSAKLEKTDVYSKNFFYPLYDNGQLNILGWNRIELNTLTIPDNDDDWNKNNEYGDYHIWRYVTENTIPGTAQRQKNGLSTGVAFRGVMKATENTPDGLKAILNATSAEGRKDIYIYKDGTFFAGWDAVKEEATKEGNKETALAAAYEKCKDKTGDELKKAAVEEKFTIYSYDEKAGGYATVYFYWNRHWDNGNDGVMNPMEFAVVRNNVYKLAVTEISGLGHPRNPGDDPDPVDPNDPDEKSDVKIKVQVQVKKWVVRVNNIKF